MKSGASCNHSRRSFIKGLVGTVLVAPFVESCKNKIIQLMVLMRLTGPRHLLGHRLWAKDFPEPSESLHIPYLIVGGGISGLSAARHLKQKGISDFLLIELEDHLGGNSSNGENAYSKFPLAAHYLPLPNVQDKELLRFLHEAQIITTFDEKGLPVFDEEQLCFAPEERLYYKNTWQEGLIPRYGNSTIENEEFQRFFAQMDHFRAAKGSDGKYLFNIPLSLSSEDESNLRLDRISMLQWLENEGFQQDALKEYVDYCCRDDYGLGIKWVSAWAGIHYFAGRKQDASTDKKDNVLTWPEGNARLAAHLKKHAEGQSWNRHLVYEIRIHGDKVVAKAYSEQKKTSIEITADRAILATPQFINQYLLDKRKPLAEKFHYAPWLSATLTLTDLADQQTVPLCWDNVIHGSKGLGYVYNQHQQLGQMQNKKVITYYRSFPAGDLRKERRKIFQQPISYWKQAVMDDLKQVHPDIESLTEEISIHLLGHGMISPVPGFIFGETKKAASNPIDNKIFFAHSDLSGISIFEEAFHQGIRAAEEMLESSYLEP